MLLGSEVKAWKESDDALLAQMWKEGRSARDIAKALGRTAGDIFSRRCSLNLPTKHEYLIQRINSPEFEREFKHLYESEASFAEIMDRMKIGQHLVYRVIARLGLKRRKTGDMRRTYRRVGKRKYSDKIVAQIKEKKDAGQDIQTIADSLGMQYDAVNSICSRYKIRKTRRRSWSKEETEKMVEMLREGSSLQSVSDKIQRTFLAVQARCAKIGVAKEFPQLVNVGAKMQREVTMRQSLRQKIGAITTRGVHKNELDIDYVMELYEKQRGECFYTGVKMSARRGDPNTVSIDRIDSSLGYIKGNVVLCIWRANLMKQTLKIDEFLDIASSVHRRREAIERGLKTIANPPPNDPPPVPESVEFDFSKPLP